MRHSARIHSAVMMRVERNPDWVSMDRSSRRGGQGGGSVVWGRRHTEKILIVLDQAERAGRMRRGNGGGDDR